MKTTRLIGVQWGSRNDSPGGHVPHVGDECGVRVNPALGHLSIESPKAGLIVGKVVAIATTETRPSGRDGIVLVAVPREGEFEHEHLGCEIFKLLKIAYSWGINPLPTLRTIFWGKWEYVHNNDTFDSVSGFWCVRGGWVTFTL